MSSKRPIVWVDTREYAAAKDIVEILKKEFLCVVIPKKLEAGDYAVSEDVGIERKSASDFVKSIIDGRLFDQSSRLIEAFSRPVIIIEGDLSLVLQYRKIHPNSVYGALLSLVRRGISVVQVPSRTDVARVIYLLARQEQVDEGKRPYVKMRKKEVPLHEQQITFLASLPGIGPTRAVEILKKFKTPMNALLNVSKWPKFVHSIGEKTVEKVKKVLYSEFKEPESSGT